MTRSLSSRSTLPTLKREAKRWLAALRADDPSARARLLAAWPAAPDTPVLRDVQHALAREYGTRDWRSLTEEVEARHGADAAQHRGPADVLAMVLAHGWNGHAAIARRIVAQQPALRTANVFVAAACGETETVRKLITHDSTLVHAQDDVRLWTALAHVMYGRLDAERAVEIATLLLDAGADVHFRFDDGWGNPFTLITGAIGQGEGVKPTHPQAAELIELLLARGADPYDTQALYNTSIVADDITWTARLWSACEARGTTARWLAQDEHALGGRFRSNTLDYLLGNAVTSGHAMRARWCLDHGADANARHAYSGRALHTEARLAGDSALVDVLQSFGAHAETLRDHDALLAAIMRDDGETVQSLVSTSTTLPRSAAPLVAAARANRARMLDLLLTLGADVHARDAEGATALHRAVQGDARAAVERLLAAGADANARDAQHDGSALGWALVLHRPELAELLAEHSRDVRSLARGGFVERLEAVLASDASLASVRLRDADAPTVLFHLPDDEEDAVQVVRLLLAHGADPLVSGASGNTAAQVAALRGLDEAAALLSVRSS